MLTTKVLEKTLNSKRCKEKGKWIYQTKKWLFHPGMRMRAAKRTQKENDKICLESALPKNLRPKEDLNGGR